jgi:hypothetical protein
MYKALAPKMLKLDSKKLIGLYRLDEKKLSKVSKMTVNNWLRQNYSFQNEMLEEIENISYFTLVWGVFEQKCCGGFAKIAEHPEQLSTELDICSELLTSTFEYFKIRYITTECTENLTFVNFKFGVSASPLSYKNKVKTVLCKQIPTKKEKIEALLYISFRLRNNLYHGEKEITSLIEQDENFSVINEFLIALIEAYSNLPQQERSNRM